MTEAATHHQIQRVTAPSPALILGTLAWGAALVFCVSLPLWEAPKNISLGIALAALLAGGLLGRPRLTWDIVCFGLLAYVATRLISAAASEVPGLSLARTVGDFRTLAAYFVFLNLTSSPGRARLASSLLMVSAATALLWSVTHHAGSMDFLSLCSVGHGNNFGMYTALSVALPASLLVTAAGSWRLRLFAAAALLLFAAGLGISLCRGAMLAAAMFAFFLVFLEGYRPRRPHLALLALCFAAGLAATLLVIPPEQMNKLLSPVSDLLSSVERRSRIWLGGWRVFLARPLLGSGPHNYRALAANLTPGPLLGADAWLGNAHQLYLNVLAETGLVGMAGFVALLLAVWAKLRRLRARLPSGEPHAYWLAASGAWLIMLVMGLVDVPFHGEHALLLAALLGLAAGLGRAPANFDTLTPKML